MDNLSDTLYETSIKAFNFVVVDLETTGFSSRKDSVVEIGAVKIINGDITDKYESLIHTKYIPYYATKAHGITTVMVKDAPLLTDVRKEFCKFAEDCVFVGHNIKRFDRPFLSKYFNISEFVPYVDTMDLSRALFPDQRIHRLSVVAERIGVQKRDYHRALNDAIVTAHIFIKFLMLGQQKFRTLSDISER